MPIRDEQGNQCHHVVRLHLRSLGTPRVSEFTALANAQRTYGPHGICIKFESGMSMPQAVDTATQCVELVNVNVGTCLMNQGTFNPRMTGQQSAMFGIGDTQNVPATNILAVWVENVRKEDGTRLAGCASHPADRGACVVAAAGSPWTLAHEVGHVLGLVHQTGSRNLMSTPTSSISANPPELSATQIATVKRSRYCQRI